MNSENIANLNLIGANEEDLKVISAYLQDSIVTVQDIVFLKNCPCCQKKNLFFKNKKKKKLQSFWYRRF